MICGGGYSTLKMEDRGWRRPADQAAHFEQVAQGHHVSGGGESGALCILRGRRRCAMYLEWVDKVRHVSWVSG